MVSDGAEKTAGDRRLAAAAWAGAWERIDLQLSQLGLEAIEALDLRPGQSVLDVGCGAGQTILQLSDRVGPSGRVIGVDIAPALLDIARRRTAGRDHVQWIEGDAQRVEWPSASVDAVFSRFGVMAFEDPVAAFVSFRRLLRPSGKLAFCCWRSLEENELDWLPLKAAGLDAAADETPFRFADRKFLRRVLTEAGFDEIQIRPYDAPVSSGDLDAMVSVLLAVGSLGKIVRENPALRGIAEPRLRETLSARGDPERVTLRASIWIVSARA